MRWFVGLLRFQFQTGAIKRLAQGSGLQILLGFNSKLVRLKGNFALGMHTEPAVSIPNWCD